MEILGTSTSKEAQEYFSKIVDHMIEFDYVDEEDDKAIDRSGICPSPKFGNFTQNSKEINKFICSLNATVLLERLN